ncbi:MAG: NUDIX hydrolase [Pseudomonadales bacterium]|nr:NUDIX hydrolase [Pseudomonadales bacterium]
MANTELPHVTVATVVPREGRFLMVRERSDGLLVYNQPAGHVEPEESILDAAIRETLEETAWHIHLESYLGTYQHVANNGISYIRHCFVASAGNHDPQRELDQDIEAALWLSADEIAGLQDQLRSPMVWRAIEDYVAGNTYPLSLFKL